MSGQRSTLQTLIEASAIVLAVAIQVAGELYLTNPDFKYQVDVQLSRARYWLRRKDWEARWAKLPGWKREAVEQVHGTQ